MANVWKTFDIKDATKNSVEEVRIPLSSVMKALTTFIETGVGAMDVLSSTLSFTENVHLAGFQLLLSEVQSLLTGLSETGIYSLSVMPNSLQSLGRHRGGFGLFKQTFLESMHDYEDPNRPQISETGALGGVFLVLTEENPAKYIDANIQLHQLFGKECPIRFPTPINLKTRWADSLGMPIENSVLLFTQEQPTSLRLEWQEPCPQGGRFLDVFQTSKFYIERSKNREGFLRLREKTPEESTPLDEEQEGAGRERYVEPFLDNEGNPIYCWEPLNPDDPFIDPILDAADVSQNRLNFLSGQYAYVIKDLERGIENGYYYRIRAVPRAAKLVPYEALVLNHQKVQETITLYDLVTGIQSIQKSCPPSAPILGYLPKIDTSFDLPTAVHNVFRSAYLLRFDTVVTTNSGAQTLMGSGMLDRSLSHVLDKIKTASIHQDGSSEVIKYWGKSLYDDVEDLKYPTTRVVKSLAVAAQDMDPFGGVDEYLVPLLKMGDRERVRHEIERRTWDLTKKTVKFLVTNESLREMFQEEYLRNQDWIHDVLTNDLAFDSSVFRGSDFFREEIYVLMQILKGGTNLGTPPNWKSLKLLEDLFPIAAEIEQKLFDLLRSINNSFQSIMDDFQDSLASIRQRLLILQRASEALADFSLVLEVFGALGTLGFSILVIPPETGGTRKFISNFINAEEPPEQNDRQYVAGLVLAYGGNSTDDFSAIANAFKLLWG